MQTKYHVSSWPATLGGLIAAGGSIAFLVRDALATGWTIEHGAMPALVVLTILVAHLFTQALREWRAVSAIAFLVLALAGSLIIGTETMGRRAEVRDTKVAVVTKSTDDLARIGAEFSRQQKLVAEAESWVAGECASGKGKKCGGVQHILDQRTSHLNKLRADLEAAKPAAPADPKADRLADVAALAGLDRLSMRNLVQTLDPFTLALFFELASVFLFGFGIRSKPVPRPIVEVLPEPPPAERETFDPAVDWVRAYRARHGRDPQIPEVMRACNLPKTTAWRRIRVA